MRAATMFLALVVTVVAMQTSKVAAIASQRMNSDVEQSLATEALRRLFDKYAGHRSSRMTFEGFEHLLENLGLGNVTIVDHDVHDHQTNDGQFRALHDNHIHKDAALHSRASDKHDHPHGTSHDHERRRRRSAETDIVQRKTSNSTEISKCLTAVDILLAFNKKDSWTQDISKSDIVNMCPVILYQLDEHLCHPERHPPCHAESVNKFQHCRRYHVLCREQTNRQHVADTSDQSPASTFTDPSVWLSATVAVTIVSLVGLAVVALIPAMSQRAFYGYFLHFLVAVAVATLTGDALLHLIPHALVPHGAHESVHVNVTSAGEHHHGQGEDEQRTRLSAADAIWKGLVVLAGMYVFFLCERLISICRTPRRRPRNKNTFAEVSERLSAQQRQLAVYNPDSAANGRNVDTGDDGEECLERLASGADASTSRHRKHHKQQQHHGHSHAPVSSSIASAAWMVIVGDGLHNFTDGLAIGVAFASSFAGGIGTTTAVFCHELPHELGDFAVLLRSGMTVKQAIMYNMVSSVLAFTGMCLGIVLGSLHRSASTWVFALTAGIFLYVSLVDMLPELTKDEDESSRSKCISLVLDVVGLSVGLAIMTSIAFFEDDIQQALAD